MKRKPINKRQIVLIITGICFLWIGGTMYMDHLKLEEEMNKVVKSEEAKEIFEETLKTFDQKAFTEEAEIKLYEIEESSIRRNPMGGINVTIHVNGSEELYINFTLTKKNDVLKNGAFSYASELLNFNEGVLLNEYSN
ncbi:DUF1310 family protein [Enterococcus mundtii]|uniref:DUF1310 domain-containing protein n=1 Tax=Enterococcus mundtii TaxID=53346 RepID=A0A2S7RQ27_ENTMU|nr:DUF1310 family protein [Enterococcus mundtii]PQF21686.1 hypothetical protein CUS89_13050 [Enterococcus mundtii]